jgi:hypothetical protein
VFAGQIRVCGKSQLPFARMIRFMAEAAIPFFQRLPEESIA